MYKLRIIGLILLAVLLAGCFGGVVTGSGKLVTQRMDYDDFDKLDVSQGFHVEVQQSDTFSVVIRVDDNLVDFVQVTKSGSTLQIGLKPDQVYNLRDVTLEADVTMPELTGMDLSGGSHVNLNDFSSAKALVADISGGSHLTGEADLGDIRFDLSGGSHTTLSGSAENLTLNVSGGSHGKLGNLEVIDVDVYANGGSHTTVHPSGTLDASASGGSHIKYRGTPTLGTLDDDGSSSIKEE